MATYLWVGVYIQRSLVLSAGYLSVNFRLLQLRSRTAPGNTNNWNEKRLLLASIKQPYTLSQFPRLALVDIPNRCDRGETFCYLFVPTLPFATALLVVSVPLRDLPRNNGRFVNDAATKGISKFV